MSKRPISKWNRAEFRLHPGLTATPPHWLATHLYGRVLLASELRRTRPELACPRYDPGLELLPQGCESGRGLRG